MPHNTPIASALAEHDMRYGWFLTPSEVPDIWNGCLMANHNIKKSGTGKKQKLRLTSCEGDYIQWLDKNSCTPLKTF